MALHGAPADCSPDCMEHECVDANQLVHDIRGPDGEGDQCQKCKGCTVTIDIE